MSLTTRCIRYVIRFHSILAIAFLLLFISTFLIGWRTKNIFPVFFPRLFSRNCHMQIIYSLNCFGFGQETISTMTTTTEWWCTDWETIERGDRGFVRDGPKTAREDFCCWGKSKTRARSGIKIDSYRACFSYDRTHKIVIGHRGIMIATYDRHPNDRGLPNSKRRILSAMTRKRRSDKNWSQLASWFTTTTTT